MNSVHFKKQLKRNTIATQLQLMIIGAWFCLGASQRSLGINEQLTEQSGHNSYEELQRLCSRCADLLDSGQERFIFFVRLTDAESKIRLCCKLHLSNLLLFKHVQTYNFSSFVSSVLIYSFKSTEKQQILNLKILPVFVHLLCDFVFLLFGFVLFPVSVSLPSPVRRPSTTNLVTSNVVLSYLQIIYEICTV